MNNAQAQHRRPAATVGRIRSQTRHSGRFTADTAATAATAIQTAPQPARVSRGNTAGGGVIIK